MAAQATILATILTRLRERRKFLLRESRRAMEELGMLHTSRRAVTDALL